MPRPWSKYSEGASAHAKVKAAEAAENAELEPAKVSVREEKKKRKLKHANAEGADKLSHQVFRNQGLGAEVFIIATGLHSSLGLSECGGSYLPVASLPDTTSLALSSVSGFRTNMQAILFAQTTGHADCSS